MGITDLPVWKRSLPRIKTLAIAYTLFCVSFYFFQQRLLFYPAQELANTPDLYPLDHQTINIPIPPALRRLKFKRDTVNAMAIARRLRAIIKHMAEVAAAGRTVNLRPQHHQRAIFAGCHRIF